MADIMNTTVYTKKAVLGFQRFDARMFKSVAWGTHAVFFMLFAIALAVARIFRDRRRIYPFRHKHCMHGLVGQAILFPLYSAGAEV